MDGILHVQMKNQLEALCLKQAPYGRASASSLAALSPYGRENENHIECFHGLTSIVLQEALQLTTSSSGRLEMNLQAPLGCLHPDPAMLAFNRALNDDLLDNDLHHKIAAAAKMNDFARLEVLSARCDQDVDNRAKKISRVPLLSCHWSR